MDSGAVEPETGPEVEVLKSEMKIYSLFRDNPLNGLVDEYELDTGFVLIEKVHMVLDEPS